jgi:hypothetical protein
MFTAMPHPAPLRAAQCGIGAALKSKKQSLV